VRFGTLVGGQGQIVAQLPLSSWPAESAGRVL
jgi:hypothetical protein